MKEGVLKLMSCVLYAGSAQSPPPGLPRGEAYWLSTPMMNLISLRVARKYCIPASWF